jgi:primosomal protein N' (replication factor Y)
MQDSEKTLPRYARIAVNVPRVQGVYDYYLPESIQGELKIGQLVTVPFGRQTVQGIIIKFPGTPEVPQTKDLLSILDPLPVVTPFQIKLAQQITQETFSPLGVTLHAMLPAGLSVKVDSEYHLTERSLTLLESGEPLLPELTPAQTRLLELMIDRGSLRGRQIDRALPHKNWRKTADALERRGVISSKSTLGAPSVKPKLERRLKFISEPGIAMEQMDTLSRAGFPDALARRQAVLGLIMESERELPLSEIYQKTGSNLNDLKQLIQRGLAQIQEVPVLRDPLEEIPVLPTQTFTLTEDQKSAWDLIKISFVAEDPIPFLLHGVTGSGKTELYLRAVQQALTLGKQAIILVPEIALTPQTVSRFMSRFPGRVGVLHSELSPGERYDTWRLAREGKLSIMVGPRSALFTPFPDPGLIVVDECHDDSYYQGDISPRYHAVQSAVDYASITSSVCILGSATPDITSMYRATRGDWQLISLPERILAHKDSIQIQLKLSTLNLKTPRYQPLNEDLQMAELPEVKLVDMRVELKEGNRSIFSRSLQDSLFSTLDKDQQAILFLNRRGSATYVFCRDCGYAMRCPRCDTSLTAHQKDNSLRCHHCGYRRNIPRACPACGSNRIRHLGTGTEQVESALQELIPGIRTMRWDRDTTRKKGAHWEIMESFSSHRADVLIGTQMLAKGLDLPLVTLVGVVLGDIGLHLPDYRAAERTFQVLTQVAGRAGRSPLGGEVILQTFTPEHYVIEAASQHNYRDFYLQELEYRRDLGYPPFYNLVRLEFRAADPKKAEGETQAYAAVLGEWIKTEGYRATQLVGPTPPYYTRIRGETRWQILLRGPNPLNLVRDHPPGPDWIIEVNPPVIL